MLGIRIRASSLQVFYDFLLNAICAPYKPHHTFSCRLDKALRIRCAKHYAYTTGMLLSRKEHRRT
jgi:hypothetical protein